MFAIPLLGLCTGLRTMTPIALVCWYARLGYLPMQGTWAFWLATPITVGVFSLLAVGEYIGDKLPNTPNRTAPLPLISRLAFGGFVGAIIATSLRGSVVEGAVLAILGAALGTFGGYRVRHYLVHNHRWPDMPIALVEDVLTLVLSLVALAAVPA